MKRKYCTVEGCNNFHVAKGHCWKHYKQLQKYGKIKERTTHDANIFVIKSGLCFIRICSGESVFLGYAFTNAGYYKMCKKHKWHFSNGYVFTTINNKHVGLHNLILGAKGVDHINRNPKDNRKENLRVCKQSENSCNIGISKLNSSGYKGVCWSKSNNKWFARITKDKISYNLGFFEDKKDAAKAYNKAALELHKEFAVLNPVLMRRVTA